MQVGMRRFRGKRAPRQEETGGRKLASARHTEAGTEDLPSRGSCGRKIVDPIEQPGPSDVCDFGDPCFVACQRLLFAVLVAVFEQVLRGGADDFGVPGRFPCSRRRLGKGVVHAAVGFMANMKILDTSGGEEYIERAIGSPSPCAVVTATLKPIPLRAESLMRYPRPRKLVNFPLDDKFLTKAVLVGGLFSRRPHHSVKGRSSANPPPLVSRREVRLYEQPRNFK